MIAAEIAPEDLSVHPRTPIEGVQYELDEIVQDVWHNGVVMPLACSQQDDGKIYVLDGVRRYLAARIVNFFSPGRIKTIPVNLFKDLSIDAEMRVILGRDIINIT